MSRRMVTAWILTAAVAAGCAPEPVADPAAAAGESAATNAVPDTDSRDSSSPRIPVPDTRVLVPEAYELANVVIAVSRYGRDSPHAVHDEGDYYERVMERFLPWAGHPVVRDIEPLLEASYRNYYGFRENAFAYRLGEEGLVHGGVYRGVWTPDLFSPRLQALDDFARQSGFREFYAAERLFYEDQVRRYRQLVDLAGMGAWLHERFPGRAMDRYTVVFSPLILGSHSTRNFQVDGTREAVMFIAGPDLPLEGVDAAVRSGLHERVVFTEIDHNYVNPVTARHGPEVGEAVGDFRAWSESDNYRSARLTFNEYMTWGVFSLYALDRYDADAFDEVVSRMERQMAGRRGFVRFPEFNRELLRLYRERRPASIEALYPPILAWMRRFAADDGSDGGDLR